MVNSWCSSGAVLVTDLDDELVLLDPKTRAMFTLNATGRFIWQQLDVPMTADSIVDAMVAAFTVDRETATADVTEILTQLAAAGLVQPA